MTKFTVTNTTILHNQKTYGVGDAIELTDENQIAKLASYITPVADKATAVGSTEQQTDSATTVGTDSTTTTATKTSKSSKKSDKSASSADATNGTANATDTTTTVATDARTSTPTDGVTSDATKQEGTNGTTSV